MSKTIRTEKKDRKEIKPAVFTKADAPAMGDALGALMPKERQEEFLAWASRKPRLATMLAKGSLSPEEKREVGLAFSQMDNEKRKTALVKQEAPNVANLIGVTPEAAEQLLETYKPEQISKLAELARKEGLPVKSTVLIDLSLLNDGCYAGREEETVTVTTVHEKLAEAAEGILKSTERAKDLIAADMDLDKLWDTLLKKHKGDEMEAAKEYAEAAKSKLVDKKAETGTEFVLETETVVELFKLFNYDQKDILEFLDYVEHNLDLTGRDTDVDAKEKIFGHLLGRFIAEKKDLVLNDRSRLYGSARASQLASGQDSAISFEDNRAGDETLYEEPEEGDYDHLMPEEPPERDSVGEDEADD